MRITEDSWIDFRIDRVNWLDTYLGSRDRSIKTEKHIAYCSRPIIDPAIAHKIFNVEKEHSGLEIRGYCVDVIVIGHKFTSNYISRGNFRTIFIRVSRWKIYVFDLYVLQIKLNMPCDVFKRPHRLNAYLLLVSYLMSRSPNI